MNGSTMTETASGIPMWAVGHEADYNHFVQKTVDAEWEKLKALHVFCEDVSKLSHSLKQTLIEKISEHPALKCIVGADAHVEGDGSLHGVTFLSNEFSNVSANAGAMTLVVNLGAVLPDSQQFDTIAEEGVYSPEQLETAASYNLAYSDRTGARALERHQLQAGACSYDSESSGEADEASDFSHMLAVEACAENDDLESTGDVKQASLKFKGKTMYLTKGMYRPDMHEADFRFAVVDTGDKKKQNAEEDVYLEKEETPASDFKLVMSFKGRLEHSIVKLNNSDKQDEHFVHRLQSKLAAQLFKNRHYAYRVLQRMYPSGRFPDGSLIDTQGPTVIMGYTYANDNENVRLASIAAYNTFDVPQYVSADKVGDVKLRAFLFGSNAANTLSTAGLFCMNNGSLNPEYSSNNMLALETDASKGPLLLQKTVSGSGNALLVTNAFANMFPCQVLARKAYFGDIVHNNSYKVSMTVPAKRALRVMGSGVNLPDEQRGLFAYDKDTRSKFSHEEFVKNAGKFGVFLSGPAANFKLMPSKLHYYFVLPSSRADRKYVKLVDECRSFLV